MIFWEFNFGAIPWQMLLELLLRIVVAGLCGAFVGLERSKRLKEAGLRTHCVVAIAAALIMIISKYGFADLAMYDSAGNIIQNEFFAGTKGVDASRMASQVVSGIGFLGAGVIFKNGNVVRGITTAAGIWAVAAIGMAFGAGMYILGIFTTAFMIVVQIVLHKFPVGNDAHNSNEIKILMIDTPESRQILKSKLKSEWGLVVGTKAYREENGRRMLQITVKATDVMTPEKINDLLDQHPEILSVTM
jgi:putative Mg2+ transporter-C (MgtC) family protein